MTTPPRHIPPGFVEFDNEERDLILRFIRLVTDQPGMWDNNCLHYRDKALKKAVVCELAEKMEWTEDAVVKKFANLRTYFTKELNKEMLSQIKAKATGTTEVYKSKWPYFEALDAFLRPQIRSAKRVHTQGAVQSSSFPSVMRVNFDTDSIEHLLEENEDKRFDSHSNGDLDNRYHSDDVEDSIPSKIIKQEPVSPGELETELTNQRQAVHNATPTRLITPTRMDPPPHVAPPVQVVMATKETSDEIFAKLICEQMKRVEEGKTKEMLKIKIQQLIVDCIYDG